ncbi:MAG: hypothetical protein OXC31_26125 [Spirochaetaceae bacterium]|nr:hypothetical protein [Spirochaetaceae bacterium]
MAASAERSAWTPRLIRRWLVLAVVLTLLLALLFPIAAARGTDSETEY